MCFILPEWPGGAHEGTYEGGRYGDDTRKRRKGKNRRIKENRTNENDDDRMRKWRWGKESKNDFVCMSP